MNNLEWKDAPALIALASATAVVFTVAHEAGFFLVIDTRLMSLFSLQDILRSALAFLPLTILGLIFTGYVRLMAPPVARFFDQNEKPTRFIVWFLSLWSLCILLFDSDWANGLLMISAFNAGAITGLVLDRVENSTPNIIVVGLGLLVLFITLFGIAEGQNVRKSDRYDYELHVKGGDPTDVQLLRTTSELFLVRQNKSSVWVVPRSEVELLKRKDVGELTPVISLPVVAAFIAARWREKLDLLLAAFSCDR